MKFSHYFIFLSSLVLTSCDKNKELVQYSEHYHIDGNDTISAIYIPNTFTPDGDGINDIFKIKSFGLSNRDFVLRINNRNGENIFNSSHLGSGWDANFKGINVENGEYIYVILATDSSNYEYKIEGKVNLHR